MFESCRVHHSKTCGRVLDSAAFLCDKPVLGLPEEGKTLSLPAVRTTVSTKGQIILPAEIRREDDIKSGQEFEIERIDRGEYLLKRTTKPRNHSLVKLLLSCPVKDWFKPLHRTEPADDSNRHLDDPKTLNTFD